MDIKQKRVIVGWLAVGLFLAVQIRSGCYFLLREHSRPVERLADISLAALAGVNVVAVPWVIGRRKRRPDKPKTEGAT
jgi:hypothetical protein